MNTFSQVQTVIARILQIPPQQISPSTRRGDLAGWDSLKHLDITMELEAVCGVSFTLEEITSLDSLPRIVEVIEQKK